MKRHLILLTILTLIFASCGNKNKKEATQVINQESDRQSLKSSISFDWTKALSLKTKMISQLESKSEPTDRIIVDFLNEYTKLTDEINEELNKQSNYDSLNTLLYADQSLVKQCAKDFKKKVENNGFKIAFSEGMLYVEKSTDYIKSGTVELIDSISNQFLNQYCNEIDDICCEDAGLMISKEELVNRVYQWGELIEKVNNLEYKKIAEEEFIRNLNILYTGMDNTPTFDWNTKKYRQEFLDAMNKIIESHPDSKAAKEFTSFKELLSSENFERTQKVDDFLKEKFK